MDALYQNLFQLNNLLVQGFLSRDEYEFRRKQIINSLTGTVAPPSNNNPENTPYSGLNRSSSSNSLFLKFNNEDWQLPLNQGRQSIGLESRQGENQNQELNTLDEMLLQNTLYDSLGTGQDPSVQETQQQQQQVKQMQLEFDQSYSENHLKPSFGSLTSIDGVLSTPNKPKTPLLLKLNGENQHFFTGDRQTETHQTLSPSQLLLLKSQQSQQIPQSEARFLLKAPQQFNQPVSHPNEQPQQQLQQLQGQQSNQIQNQVSQAQSQSDLDVELQLLEQALLYPNEFVSHISNTTNEKNQTAEPSAKKKFTITLKVYRVAKDDASERTDSEAGPSTTTSSSSSTKPWKCDADGCEKRFSDRSNLIQHLRVHTEEKPYQCKKCNKNFSYSTSLKEHERTHEGSRPYQCFFCLKTFAQSSNFRRHLRIHRFDKRIDLTERGLMIFLSLC